MNEAKKTDEEAAQEYYRMKDPFMYLSNQDGTYRKQDFLAGCAHIRAELQKEAKGAEAAMKYIEKITVDATRDAKIAAARRACQLTLEIEPCRTKSLEDLWPSEQVLKIVMAKFDKELDGDE